jgi:putative ABC transport system ATP-binding protein
MDEPKRNASLLRGCDLGRKAPGKDEWLLKDVSLEVFAGDRIALVGPSGSGKSALLRLLSLLDAADSGTLELQGKPAGEPSVPEHRRKVIYLHQRPALFEGTVEFNFERPFSLKVNRDRRSDRDRVQKLLRDVGRDESFLQKRVSELSGGEAQIVALIRAVQLDPVVLLLDEATSALDEETTAAAERIVNTWLDQAEERAVLVVSHDIPQAQRFAKRIFNVSDGRLTEGSAS